MDQETDVLEVALAGLPHGPAFRFVDQLLSLEPGVRASGIYHLRGDEPFLAGHFPGEPILPGVLMVEAIAQLAGIAAGGGNLRLAGIRLAKILGSVAPGTRLRIEAEITGRLGGLLLARGSITAGANAEPLATAQVTLAAVPAP